MGGTTQTVDKNQVANSLVNSSNSTSGATTGATSASGATNPWAPAQPFLSGILAQLQGQLANAPLTPQENAALGAHGLVAPLALVAPLWAPLVLPHELTRLFTA